MTQFLYLSTVLIWGTTWIAIHWQLGDVSIFVSVFYRFALAASIMLPLMIITKKLQSTTVGDHGFMVLQGICLMSMNFVCFYAAGLTLTSGLLSVIFSLATIFNALNNFIFWREKPALRVIGAGGLGVIGLGFIFWPELRASDTNLDYFKAIGLASMGTYLFSLGNMISLRHTTKGLKPLTSNAYAMIYGACALAGLLYVSNTPLAWDSRPQYLGSLLYLAIIGTVAGFAAYLTLVARIGANKAAYATVMFPIVALALSTMFEGYIWTLSSVTGLALVLLGNGMILGIKLPYFARTK